MKRALIIATIASVMLLASLIPMAEAVVIDDNPVGSTLDSLSSDDSMVNNYGHINEVYGALTNNYGTVGSTSGSIDNNYGTVSWMDGGTVDSNTGTIEYMYGGTVNSNAGKVERQNYGTIVENAKGGTIALVNKTTYQQGAVTTNNGNILDNKGTVTTNNGTISDNYGTVATNTGTITNNWGTVTTNNGTIKNQYYKVTMANDNSATVINAILNYDTAYVGASTHASLVPSAGYRFSSAPTATGCTLVMDESDPLIYNIVDVTGPVTITAETEVVPSTADCLFWVGDIPVTGTASGYGWSYDSPTNTLTLDGAEIGYFHYGAMKDINNQDIMSRSIVYDGRDSGLNIVLKNHSVLAEMTAGLTYAIYAKGDLNISGNGSLHAATGFKMGAGIWSAGELTVSGGEIVVSGCTVSIGSVGDMSFTGGSIDAMSERGGQCIFSTMGSMSVSGGTIVSNAQNGFDVWLAWNSFTMTGGILQLEGSGCLDVNGAVTIAGGSILSKSNGGYVIGVTGGSADAVLTMTGGNILVDATTVDQEVIYASTFKIDEGAIAIRGLVPMKYDDQSQKYVICDLKDATSLRATGTDGAGLVSRSSNPVVTFDANGGACSTKYIETKNGKLPSLPTPEWAGHSFDGWYTQKDGGTKVTTSTVFIESTTVYAHWSVAEYLVTLNASPSSGGSFMCNGSPYSSPYYAGGIVKIVAIPAQGYEFLYWNDDRALGAARTVDVEGPITLTATFSPSRLMHDVTFMDGDKTLSVQRVEDGKMAYRPADPEPASESYRFYAWVDDSGKVFDFSTKITRDTVLSADWLQFTYVSVPASIDGVFTATNSGVHEVNLTNPAPVEFSITPATGYAAQVFANGSPLVPGAGDAYSITDFSQNVTVTVKATKDQKETESAESIIENADGTTTEVTTVTTVDNATGAKTISQTGKVDGRSEFSVDAKIGASTATVAISTSTQKATVTDDLAAAIVNGAAAPIGLEVTARTAAVEMPSSLLNEANVSKVTVAVNGNGANAATITIPRNAIGAALLADNVSLSVNGSNMMPTAAAIGSSVATQAFELNIGGSDAEMFNAPVTVSIDRDIPADATNVRFYCIDNGDTADAQVNGNTVTGELWHFSHWAIVYDLPENAVAGGDDLPPMWHYVPQQTHHSSMPLIAAACAAAIAAMATALVALVAFKRN